MLGRSAVAAAVIALAGCAGMESAGRNAARDGVTPARVERTAPPPAATTAPAPTTAPSTSPPTSSSPVTAAPPSVAVQPPPPPAIPAPTLPTSPSVEPPPIQTTEPARDTPAARAGSGDLVVPGQREQQVPAPQGDPRSTAERMEDIRAWDRCVMRVQSAFDADPMRPQLESPEEYCRQSLGMANRNAIPQSRLERR